MTSSQTQTTEFFWMATLQKPMPGGMASQTSWGTKIWTGPATRYALIDWFMNTYVPAELPQMRGANIIHWECEPNDYTGTARPALRSVSQIRD